MPRTPTAKIRLKMCFSSQACNGCKYDSIPIKYQSIAYVFSEYGSIGPRRPDFGSLVLGLVPFLGSVLLVL